MKWGSICWKTRSFDESRKARSGDAATAKEKASPASAARATQAVTTAPTRAGEARSPLGETSRGAPVQATTIAPTRSAPDADEASAISTASSRASCLRSLTPRDPASRPGADLGKISTESTERPFAFFFFFCVVAAKAPLDDDDDEASRKASLFGLSGAVTALTTSATRSKSEVSRSSTWTRTAPFSSLRRRSLRAWAVWPRTPVTVSTSCPFSKAATARSRPRGPGSRRATWTTEACCFEEEDEAPARFRRRRRWDARRASFRRRWSRSFSVSSERGKGAAGDDSSAADAAADDADDTAETPALVVVAIRSSSGRTGSCPPSLGSCLKTRARAGQAVGKTSSAEASIETT
mmetsp:Transcript_11481/g.37727  ORF Transcript_11481/g.37727 Transcript_11481/m.37727 type:complete len:351 (-) Transcript_11481:480-1532(-)